MSTLAKRIRMIAVSAILAAGAGAASDALASAGVFTVNPTNGTDNLTNSTLDPSINASFTSNGLTGTASTQLTTTNGMTYTAAGYLDYQAFNGTPLNAIQTGLNAYWGLYVTFSETINCGAAGLAGPCTVSNINLNMYANAHDTDTFNAATLTSAASVTGPGPSGDILIGSANTVEQGTAGIDSLGGAYENVNTNFTLTTPAGQALFSAPNPFYSLAFSEFNNTSTGINCNALGSVCTINDTDTGSTIFNNTPEPASVAIFGLGLIALTFMRRKSL